MSSVPYDIAINVCTVPTWSANVEQVFHLTKPVFSVPHIVPSRYHVDSNRPLHHRRILFLRRPPAEAQGAAVSRPLPPPRQAPSQSG